LKSQRSGLVMESGGKVKMRGVEVAQRRTRRPQLSVHHPARQAGADGEVMRER
jgi:hypothetical protein